MNKRQKLTKKLAKRAKARDNKKIVTATAAKKPKYISKAEREKIAAEAEDVNLNTEDEA